MSKALTTSLLVLIAVYSANFAHAGDNLLSAPEAYRMMQAGQLILIDVRSPGEWKQTGIPAGAKAITMHDPRGLTAFRDRVLATAGNDPSRPIALICAHGNRSKLMQAFLSTQNFTAIHDVGEGMLGRTNLPGWLRRGLPVVPCPTC